MLPMLPIRDIVLCLVWVLFVVFDKVVSSVKLLVNKSTIVPVFFKAEVPVFALVDVPESVVETVPVLSIVSVPVSF